MKRSLWEHEAACANEVAYGCEVCLRHDKERFTSYFAKQNASWWQSRRFIRAKASTSFKTLPLYYFYATIHLKVGDFMKWLKKLFKKNRQLKIEPIPPMSSWNEIVELLYDKNLDAFCDEVINVLYSKDNSMRYVVLKDEKNIFTYELEAIYQFDEDEWKYICSNDDALPAMWEPYLGRCGHSLFANVEDLMKDLKSQPEYKQYFI